jgi:predicted phage terminase large subunit-like protein
MSWESTSLPNSLQQQVYRSRIKRARKRTLESGENRPAYSNLTVFKKHLYKLYEHAPHLEALDTALEQVAEYVESGGKRGIGRLIVEMPPRHGKTLTVSRLFPIWFLGRNPDKRVMLVSYGATLAHRNSRIARNLIETSTYHDVFPDWVLAGDSAAADTWDIKDHEGGCDAMGITGGATGKGAHVLIIDDPIKNRQEAESEVYRERVWDAYLNDLYTRLEPGGAIVVMMTRWHQDDLIGRLLRQTDDDDDENAETWVRLRMPALAEEHDQLGRQPGEALWPWRYPLKRLKRILHALGEYVWNALYQQNPVPSEGGLFKRAWLKPVDGLPEIDFAARYWDLAMSAKTSADYTVGVKIGHGMDGHWYVLDVVRRQLDWGQVTQFLADVMLHDGPEVMQGIEEAGYMSRAVQDLNADSRLHGYAIYGYPVDKDKLTRALPVAAKFAAGLLHIVQAGWNRDYVDELCSFPKGAHDDQVDGTSGAWAMLGGPPVTEGALNLAADTGISASVY